MFFLMIPVFVALAAIIVVLPALLPAVVPLAIGLFAYHVVVKHRQHDQSLGTH